MKNWTVLERISVALLITLFAALVAQVVTQERQLNRVPIVTKGNVVQQFEYEGCTYIRRIGAGTSYTHKGNCPNPIHNKGE
jgi:hypothetical protein